ncbi:Mrp/NBP35 family ATP-binding protein [Pelotomaculum terephthalicicum JT]|uniref:Mrp/NBP35 family ATP-binding protein n=1 Tax=Pelotomaculum terephthalicicum TaxID=206393 RepID=UPI0009C96E30|nr:Mrp/NBP35 family ATP-binding protein [Pelotomaculum terephthalicicum]MCG9968899.1 Mrp/NBP35 family ATP-binding protein [Pelotomaculum terephthalicicum JT]OPX87609.1 MAG: antiporter inner membrane protein [Pelotomaculum sp. PtaB.Bin104]OPY59911.1 MAG: antiporter inner membrane protein [Pelotomaculum sp. PtaU1.Bin065]
MQQNLNHTSNVEKNSRCSHEGNTVIKKLPENESSHIKNVIAVMSGKGGVGKSSVTSLLASECRKKGYSVGVLDADITGPSLPKMFGIKGMAKSNGVAILPLNSNNGIRIMSLNLLTPNEDDPVIWRGPVISGTVKQFWTDVAWGDLDYLFVDLPPGTGDVPLTVMQSLPLNGLIVVSSPQDLAVMIVSKAIKMAKLMNVPILGLVENMNGAVCPHCGEEFELFGPSQGKEIAQKFQIPFIGGLPVDPNFSKLCDQGKIEEYDSNLFINFIPEKLTQ